FFEVVRVGCVRRRTRLSLLAVLGNLRPGRRRCYGLFAAISGIEGAPQKEQADNNSHNTASDGSEFGLRFVTESADLRVRRQVMHRDVTRRRCLAIDLAADL